MGVELRVAQELEEALDVAAPWGLPVGPTLPVGAAGVAVTVALEHALGEGVEEMVAHAVAAPVVVGARMGEDDALGEGGTEPVRLLVGQCETVALPHTLAVTVPVGE